MYEQFLILASEPVEIIDTSISNFFNERIKPRYNSASRIPIVNAFKKLLNKNNLSIIDIEDKYLKRMSDSGEVDRLFQLDAKDQLILAYDMLINFSDKISQYPALKDKIVSSLKDDAYGFLLLLYFDLIPKENYSRNNKEILSLLKNNDYYIKVFVDITKNANKEIEDYYRNKNNYQDNTDYYRILQRNNCVPGQYPDGTHDDGNIAYFNNYKYSELNKSVNKSIRFSNDEDALKKFRSGDASLGEVLQYARYNKKTSWDELGDILLKRYKANTLNSFEDVKKYIFYFLNYQRWSAFEDTLKYLLLNTKDSRRIQTILNHTYLYWAEIANGSKEVLDDFKNSLLNGYKSNEIDLHTILQFKDKFGIKDWVELDDAVNSSNNVNDRFEYHEHTKKKEPSVNDEMKYRIVVNRDKYNDLSNKILSVFSKSNDSDYASVNLAEQLDPSELKDCAELFQALRLLDKNFIANLGLDTNYATNLIDLLKFLNSGRFEEYIESKFVTGILKLIQGLGKEIREFIKSKNENIDIANATTDVLKPYIEEYIKDNKAYFMENFNKIKLLASIAKALGSRKYSDYTDADLNLNPNNNSIINFIISEMKRGGNMSVNAYSKKYIKEFLPGLLKHAKSVKDLSTIVRVAINETQNLMFNDGQLITFNQPEIVNQIGNNVVNAITDDYVFPATGGAADNLSLKMIVERWKQQPEYKDISFEELLSTAKKELEAGKVVELEHTNDEDQAAKIAADHLTEQINYYSYLHNMESLFSDENVANKELEEPENFISTFFKDVDNENINDAKEQDHVCDGSCGGNCQCHTEEQIQPMTVEDKLSNLGNDVVVTIISEPEEIQPLNDNEVKVVDFINNIAASIKR